MKLTKTFRSLSSSGGVNELDITVDFSREEGVKDIVSVDYSRISSAGVRSTYKISPSLLDEANMLSEYWMEETWLAEYHDAVEGSQLDDDD